MMIFSSIDLYGAAVQKKNENSICSTFHLENESGIGNISVYQAFPGVELVYNDMHMEYCNKTQNPREGVLEINYCREGRCECAFGEQSYCYMAANNLSISIGDYLLWAVAYRMVSSITYCANPNGDKNDYVLDTLKDFHEEYIWDKPVKNFIQLKYNKMMEMPKYDSSDAYKKRYIEGAIKDPVVELLIIPTIEDVKFDGDFDYVVMAQSPNYTPASADFILDIFREYIEEI